MVGSSLTCKYYNMVAENASGKHSSLLRYGSNFGRLEFCSTSSSDLYHKTYYGRNLRFP